MFRNHIADLPHTGALDILQTTENILAQGEAIGLSNGRPLLETKQHPPTD